MATTKTSLLDGIHVLRSVPDELEQARVKPAAAELGQEVLEQVETGQPVLKFSGALVERVAREAEGPICLLGTNLREETPYQVIDEETFFGVTTNDNPSESALNPDKEANAHVHWKATEIYIPLKGRMRLYAWLGRKRFTIEAGVGDILRVPATVPHKVEIDPEVGPTVVYVVRAPGSPKDYKQAWPPKTRP
jgi:mannose-6-phosphate isomerase-like protein (cupin superfamily)